MSETDPGRKGGVKWDVGLPTGRGEMTHRDPFSEQERLGVKGTDTPLPELVPLSRG